CAILLSFFFSSRRRHTRFSRDWSSDVCSSDLMIGSLGVLDDVTVTQSATVAELAHANPESSFGELYGAASRIGRAHIGSVVNTKIGRASCRERGESAVREEAWKQGGKAAAVGI